MEAEQLRSEEMLQPTVELMHQDLLHMATEHRASLAGRRADRGTSFVACSAA